MISSQIQIQNNHYAMQEEISPLQEQLEKKKLAMITSTAAGEDEGDEDDENFPEKVQSQEWRVEKFQCDPRTNSYQMIIFIYTLMV